MTKVSSYREQLHFFIPLAITGFLLAFTGTIVNAGLARLPSPVLLISAFSVARSFMQFLISPLHMVRSTVTALAGKKADYLKVKRFCWSLTASVAAVLAFCAYSGFAEYLFREIMDLPPNTVKTAILILRSLIFYPVGLFFKDFYHGVLILFKKTSLITVGTIIRIVVVGTIAFSIHRLTFLPGTLLAGIIFLSAAFSEGLSAYFFSKKSIGKIADKVEFLGLKRSKQSEGELTSAKILSFYWPLMLMTFVKTIMMPVINTGLAKTENPAQTIAVFAIAWGMTMNLVNPLNMFHQVSLHFTREGDATKNREVLKFGLTLGMAASGIIAVLTFTPLGNLVFREIIGVDAEMSRQAAGVLKIVMILPVVTVLRQYYWGVLIERRVTKYLGIGKIINLIFLVLTMALLMNFRLKEPAALGLSAILVGDIMELLFILYSYHGRSKE